MKVSKFIHTSILLLLLVTSACNLPSGGPTPTATEDPYQSAALTVTALASGQPSPTLFPTNTVQPTPFNTVTSGPPPATAVLTTATPSGTFFVVDVGANCRSGPGTNYDKTSSFAQGTFVPIVGRNTDSTWWQVQTGTLKCWISASTGHTTGDTSSIGVVAAPPTPTVAATAGPTLSDPVALVAELSYPSNCTSKSVQVAIRVTDAGKGINSVWLSYRYLGDGGYVGSWHTFTPNDNAAGGVYGFNYDIGAEAASELGTQNGTFQYQFYAKDNSGNTSTYPNGSVLGMPIKYCP